MPPPRRSADVGGTAQLVARNVLFLVVSQLVTAALSLVVAAVIARYLGAADYGILYVATAWVGMAFILIELGQNDYLVRTLARDRQHGGELLGTALVVRLAGWALMLLPLWWVARFFYAAADTRRAIALMAVLQLLLSIGNTFAAAARGFERADHQTLAQVSTQVLVSLAVFVAVWHGGGILRIIGSQIVAAVVAAAVSAAVVRTLGVTRLTVSGDAARRMIHGGAPFALWSVVLAIHANVDPIMLSKLGSPEAVGWYGVAMKFLGVLIFPSTVLAAALFPTLSRLFAYDPPTYVQFVRAAMKPTLIMAAPAALGTYLFAQEAVALVYGADAFAPAASNLRIMSPFVFIVFVDVTLGTAIIAANRQTWWAGVKAVCVLLGIGLNLLLIPWTQARFGNGGLGASVATVASEAGMVAAALVLIPRGVLDRSVLRDVGRVAGAGAGMTAVALLLRGLGPEIAMAASTVAYTLILFGLGGVSRNDLILLRDTVLLRAGRPDEPR